MRNIRRLIINGLRKIDKTLIFAAVYITIENN